MTEAIRWKHGARCAVTLSFDVDGETPWIYRDKALADRPLHMSMGAYGPKTGVPRILALLDRYDIKAGFFIPGWIVERYPDLCREIVRRGHEVGHHGYLHEKPFFLASREEEEALLEKSVEIFQQVLGVKPLGSRAPSADPSQHTMDLLKKHGFVYHSNMMDADLPYLHKTPPRRAGRAAHRVGEQRLPLLRLQRGAARRERHLEPAGRLRDLVGGVRGHVRRGRLLQPHGSSAGDRAALADAHARASHPSDPRQEGHLVREADREWRSSGSRDATRITRVAQAAFSCPPSSANGCAHRAPTRARQLVVARHALGAGRPPPSQRYCPYRIFSTTARILR